MSFILAHKILFLVGFAMIPLLYLLSRLVKQSADKKRQKEMAALQKRNEALNETLRNPKAKRQNDGIASPVEIQWDEETLKTQNAGKHSVMVELVEFSEYSRRKYLFPAGKTICIGCSMENNLVLPRDGVEERHCEIFMTNHALAVRSVSGAKTLLVRGKTSAYVSEDGIFLNNKDHIRMGVVDIQFRSFKS